MEKFSRFKMFHGLGETVLRLGRLTFRGLRGSWNQPRQPRPAPLSSRHLAPICYCLILSP
ncbi:MAG: hypothetical protein ABS41_11855 [Arenimonas sp. SCN 70-307]|nr:MAG: hypothetical protein ABS41_11855 [Arenimonas sp. SCN 70-307]